ncbi:glycoside hydrolase superfamily [Aspergillus pseudoustus]|uniref:Glycoside hydrolase superfamily n=1 Tax=Aspergillus pseudoustus TaxID=1810923 RepID=A0ABR4IPY9_9EURO
MPGTKNPPLFIPNTNVDSRWWREATVYQIYPRSFCDSNGDGIGDINGIISKIPYLKNLGVDVLWLCPIYVSPQHDMGYDIADYKSINPDYGSMEDWERLRDEVHRAGMKLIMDLVVNHTSIEHAWFIESRSSRVNPKRDWYYWRPARIGEDGERLPPNNWRSFFGTGSAWEWDEGSQEFYLRIFTKEQPDLNWENPEVRTAVQDIVNFWLEKGIDGFRVDAINYIGKPPGFPDAAIADPSTYYQPAMHLYLNVDAVHTYLRELNLATFAKYDAMTVGETPYVPATQMALDYVHPSRNEFDMIFQWEHMDIDRIPDTLLGWKPWALPELKQIFSRWQTLMYEHGGWNSLYMENHDQGRSVSRFGSDRTPEFRDLSAKMLAMFLSTLSGTLYIFQGQELGMANIKGWKLEEYNDVVTLTYIREKKERRIRETNDPNPDMSDLLNDIQRKGRDNGRTPMPWTGNAPHAGFTTGTPWMALNPDFAVCNAAAAVGDKTSVFQFWKEMLHIRSSWKTLVYGAFQLLAPGDMRVFAYLRVHPRAKAAMVVLNFSSERVEWEVPEEACNLANCHHVFGNYNSVEEFGACLILRPWECRLYKYEHLHS